MINPKTILILGVTGMLGQYVTKYFKKTHPQYKIVDISKNEFNIELDNEEKLWSILSHELINNPDSVIINCAGAIIQREYTTENLIKINTLFPHILQRMAEQLNTILIHITTDCVFSGNDGFRIEIDPHDATTSYGKSKSLGEPDNACVIRTSIIGEETRNKLSFLEWVKSQENKEIEGHLSQWNGVTALQLAKFIDYIIQNNLYWTGVRHYFTTKKTRFLNTSTMDVDAREHVVPESITKFELASMINSIFGLNITINKKAHELNMTLSSKYKIIETPSMFDQIAELKEFNIYE
jgi:dTDP-4-dehydrorhamnose reductase